ncbi:MAG: cytochrome c oxidase accessory protein CcoG [Phycisphaerales bacterium JB039]
MTTADRTQLRVLSTLNADGTRRWLRPWVSPGRFLRRRRAVGWFLIALFTLLPYVRIGGKPAVLLDIAGREFALFGRTFYPTDTLALALLVMTIFITVFLLTALLGRVWCGWACPQTVYLEFVYRPIERLLEGKPGRKRKEGGWRTPVKYILYLLVSMFLAHTFLAYFVGVERLAQWVRTPPWEHPTAFLVMFVTTGLMMFDFSFFREQTCVVACPYGRFQSVMLDRHSLIVTYDKSRGEPRGKLARKRKNGDVALNVAPPGDCIDCELCVRTCPTGIDIREGLQMECVGCAQCIDACDAVMERIGKPRGLIRYSSQEAVEGKRPRLLRPRVVIYPLLLTLTGGGLAAVVARQAPADITVLRGVGGVPYIVSEDAMVTTQARIKIRNRTAEQRTYQIEIAAPPEAGLSGNGRSLIVAPGAMETAGFQIVAPRSLYVDGRLDLMFRISDDDGFSRDVPHHLRGPMGRSAGAGS